MSIFKNYIKGIVKRTGETVGHHKEERPLKFNKVSPNRDVIVRKTIKYPDDEIKSGKISGY